MWCKATLIMAKLFSNQLMRIGVAIGSSLAVLNAAAATIEVVPSVALKGTFSDNSGASSKGGAGFVAEISPAVTASVVGARLNGSLDAEWRSLFKSNQEDGQQSFISFTGSGTYEAVEDRFSIAFRGGISRNNLSLFQGRSQWDANNSDDNAETRNLSITPRWSQRFGNLMGNVSYQMQLLSSASDIGNQESGTLKAAISQQIGSSPFGWQIDYTRSDANTIDSTENGQVNNSELTGTVSYRVNPQISIYGRLGRESNNYDSGNSESGITKGFGANWAPTPRTTISADRGYHTYGDTYNIRMSHRFSRIAFDFGTSRSVSSAFQSTTYSLASYYFNLFSSALLAAYPDPVERQRVVISLLKALGIPVGPGFGAFNTNAYFMERQFNGGVTVVGSRNTLALSVFRSSRESLTRLSNLSMDDDFRNNPNLKTLGATLSVSHQLTPHAGLNGSIFWTKANGDGGSVEQDSRRLGLSVGANTKFGAKTTGVLTFRRERSSGESGFTENSLTAAVTMSF